MRSALINKKSLVALNYLGKVAIVDSVGNKTGEYRISYSEEIPFKANISGAKGSAIVETLGVNLEYDKVILMSSNLFKSLNIDENTVFFIDKNPEYSGNKPLYDYTVKRICDTINEVAIAIKKVRDN